MKETDGRRGWSRSRGIEDVGNPLAVTFKVQVRDIEIDFHRSGRLSSHLCYIFAKQCGYKRLSHMVDTISTKVVSRKSCAMVLRR